MGILKSAIMGTLLAAGFSSATAPALAQQRDKVIFALPAQVVGFAYIYIAEANGYWKEAGLDVEIPLIAGMGSPNAMLAGQADFAGGTGNSLLIARTKGQTPTAVFAPFQRIGMQIVVSKEAAEKAGVNGDSDMAARANFLKGKTIAMDRPNAVPHAFVKFVAKESGLDPERDITFVPVDAPAMATALDAGRVDGFVMSAPWPNIAVEGGKAIMLYDPLGKDFPDLWPLAYQIVMAREGYCEEHVSVCERFIAGMQKATDLVRDDLPAATEAVAKYFPNLDRKLLDASMLDLQRSIPDTYDLDDDRMGRMQRFVVGTGQADVAKITSFKGFYTNAYLMKK